MAKSKPAKLWNKYFIIACLVTLCTALGMNMINSTMSVYIYSLYGNAVFSGYLNAAFAVMAILARLIGGRFSDRFGRRIVMVAGVAIFAVSAFAFGIFPFPAALILFRSLQGFGYATSSTASNAISADVVPSERLGEGISYLGLGYSLATAFGALAALSLIRGNDYSMVYYTTSILLLFGVVLSLFCGYEKDKTYINKLEAQKKNSASVDLLNYKGISRFIEYSSLPAALTQIFNCTAWACVNSFILLFANSRGYANTGVYFTCSAIAMLLSRLSCGRLADKYGIPRIAVPGMVISIISFLIIWFTDSSLMFYISGILIGFGNGIINPVLNAQAMKVAPVNRRGAASGTYQMSNDIANGVGAVLWGIVIDLKGYSAAFAGCIVFIVIAIGLCLWFFHKDKGTIHAEG